MQFCKSLSKCTFCLETVSEPNNQNAHFENTNAAWHTVFIVFAVLP